LGGHFVTDSQARRIVGRTVHPFACGQLSHGFAQAAVIHGQGLLCDERLDVGIDGGHERLRFLEIDEFS
jgi:hypothetical protein